MRRMTLLLLLLLSLGAGCLAAADAPAEIPPEFVVIDIGGKQFLLETAQQPQSDLPRICDACDLDLLGRCQALDGWYPHTLSRHQYRTYYYAACRVCQAPALLYEPGKSTPHAWQTVGHAHLWRTQHTVEDECRICHERTVSYVFCPGPDGGGCTVP